MNSRDIRHLKICEHKGIPIKENSYILDFGCGDGHRVYQLIDLGFKNSFGFNKADYMGAENPVNLRRQDDIQMFRFSVDGTIPFPDMHFDLVLSDQVFEHVLEQEGAFRERHGRRGGDAAARETGGFAAYGEIVWSWHPDAGVKFLRNKFLRGEGGKKARSPGRARYNP